MLYKRSYTISDEFLTIDGLKINFDFVATPTSEPRKATINWNHFFKRVPWDIQQQPAPARLTAMEILPGVVYYYDPIAPFDLAEDRCSDWLEWHVHTLVNGNDIHALRTRDPATDTSKTNVALNREIGSKINHEIYYSNQRGSLEENENNNLRSNKRRSPDRDADETPITAKYLRESLDRQYDRFVREVNRVSNRIQNNRRQQYNGPNYNNNNNPNMIPVSTQPQPVVQPQAISATPSGNILNLSQLSNEDLLSLFRNRDRHNFNL